ncbi:hypothetical protein Tco_0407038 [Tanacetum coccineum]
MATARESANLHPKHSQSQPLSSSGPSLRIEAWPSQDSKPKSHSLSTYKREYDRAVQGRPGYFLLSSIAAFLTVLQPSYQHATYVEAFAAASNLSGSLHRSLQP